MEPSEQILDIVGVGFGPSNISLAAAIEELNPKLAARFVERRPEFSWHPGLMFPAAEMQVSFLKDLVTLRNPNSPYSFLSYLHERGRLHDFVNLRTFYPTRTEFNDYYAWVAGHFDDIVSYGQEIIDVSTFDNEIFRISTRDVRTGAVDVLLARNVVIANGGTPRVPVGVQLGSRVVHASQALPTLLEHFTEPDAPYSFSIVGAGQTAADVFTYLSDRYTAAKVTMSMRSFAMIPEDDTHFVNELFFPEVPDWFHSARAETKRHVSQRYASAVHSGVSYDLIPQIYRKRYESQVNRSDLYHFERFRELTTTDEDAYRARATFTDLESGRTITEEYDLVLIATGYEYRTPLAILTGLNDHLCVDEAGSYIIERDYRVKSNLDAGLYLQGYGESSHGFSEVLLSLMPHRAADIVRSISPSSHSAHALSSIVEA